MYDQRWELTQGPSLCCSLADAQPKIFDKLPDPKFNLALENHMYGMPPSMYDKYPILSEWYTIISTTKDRNGTEYVSSMEGKKMPFFGESQRWLTGS